MPVPFEALLPFGVVVVMFTAAGTLASAIKQYENYGVVSLANVLVPILNTNSRPVTGSTGGIA